MVKFLQPNKAAIILQGRYAGRRAAIIRSFDEGTSDRPYGHCLVPGTSAFSTSAGGGGRGRGRGSTFSDFRFTKDHESTAVKPSSPGFGHGDGGGKPPPPPPTRSPVFSFVDDTTAAGSSPSVGLGRGRGSGSGTILPGVPPQPSDPRRGPDSLTKKEEASNDSPRQTDSLSTSGRGFSRTPVEGPLPSSILSVLSGAGRGKPSKLPSPEPDKPKEDNRHIRARTLPTEHVPPPERLSREEAVKKAVRILSKDGDGAEEGGKAGRGGFRGRGRGSRGRGMQAWRGRGRGGRGERGSRFEDADDDYGTGLYLGDNADGEKMAQRLGPEIMNELVEGFEEMSSRVLPSRVDDAYLDALHTNLSIECEPEYMMEEFGTNPDIDEKPPIPLRDALEKMKPFLMAFEGIESQQEWEEVVEETMQRAPLLKEIVDYYSGPDRVTAKQQQEELERVAKMLPESAPTSVKRFTERAVLSLQSNPGWGFDKKCQFMDKLVWEVSQNYK